MTKTSQMPVGPSFSRVAGLTCAVMTGTVLLVGACTSTPPAPTQSLDAARTAITTAEKADAGRYAVVELGEARQKLSAAEKAVTEMNMIAAEQLAEQALVEAELASARTETAKAVAVNKEMNQGADALAEEMQRSGDQR